MRQTRRLRPLSEYAAAIRAVLPDSQVFAMNYEALAQRTADRLGLTQNDLRVTRPHGCRSASQHRATLSAVLFSMGRRREVCHSGFRRRRLYWLASQARYAGAASEPTRERIARRAYEIFAGRGYAHGCHEQDWLQAERELRGG